MQNYNNFGFGGFPYRQPNFYQNPMQPQPQPQQPQLNTYAFVNGIEGAKAFQVQPNQTMMLMDSDQPIVYMKQANALGQSTLRYFKLVEINETDLKGLNQTVAPQNIDTSKFVSRDEFNAKINELMAKISPTNTEAK